MITISHIVAMTANRVIGVDNQLPWHLPADLKHFKSLTMGKPIVMGRKTWESIGRPLPGRLNIVISQQPGFHAEGAQVFESIDEALSFALEHARTQGLDEVMVIGGAQIYAATLSRCQRLHVTEVNSAVEGDALYPVLDQAIWGEASRECYPAGEGGEPSYCFVTYQKKAGE